MSRFRSRHLFALLIVVSLATAMTLWLTRSPPVTRTPTPDQVSKARQTFELLNAAYRTWEMEATGEVVHTFRLKGETTDADLARLPRVPFAHHIEFANFAPGVTDAGLQQLKNRSGLIGLDLSGTGVTDSGLALLSKFADLEILSFGKSRADGSHTADTIALGEQSLAAIKKCKKLRMLDLRMRPLTDAAAAQLADLTTLEHLDLSRTLFTAEGLAAVAPLQKLKSLKLDVARITDDSLRHLRGLHDLTNLSLAHTPISDVGLTHLGSLKSLKSLDLFSTQVVGTGLNHLGGLTELTTLTPPDRPLFPGSLRSLRELKRLITLRIADDRLDDNSLRDLWEIGLLHALPQAIGENGRRPNSANEVVEFHLSKDGVTDESLNILLKLTALRRLSLPRRAITDKAIKALAETGRLHMTNIAFANRSHEIAVKRAYSDGEIHHLLLCNVPISDDALLALSKLTGLAELDVRESRVTEAGVKRFQQARPNCEVKWKTLPD